MAWGIYTEHSESGRLERKQTGVTHGNNLDLDLLRQVIVLDNDEIVEWITIDLDKTR